MSTIFFLKTQLYPSILKTKTPIIEHILPLENQCCYLLLTKLFARLAKPNTSLNMPLSLSLSLSFECPYPQISLLILVEKNIHLFGLWRLRVCLWRKIEKRKNKLERRGWPVREDKIGMKWNVWRKVKEKDKIKISKKWTSGWEKWERKRKKKMFWVWVKQSGRKYKKLKFKLFHNIFTIVS